MRIRVLLLVAVVGVAVPCTAELGRAPFAVGFAVGLPCALPIDWSGSFSVLTGEAFLSPNLTVAADVGTYPASFPDLFEGGLSVLVKGWLGASCIFGGGGLTVRWDRFGSTWASGSHLNLKAGIQAWILDSVALVVQARSIEPFPVSWTLTPELSLGVSIALGSARPESLFADGPTLWILVGLGVAALVAFLPRT